MKILFKKNLSVIPSSRENYYYQQLGMFLVSSLQCIFNNIENFNICIIV